jgi:putative transposase
MIETDWHHAPLHRFVPGAVYMITGATLDKTHYFRNAPALSLFQNHLLEGFAQAGWTPQAWACLSNHYHLIAQAPDEGDLSATLRRVHTRIGHALNKRDQVKGRRVMYQFWDRCISYDSSYYARLHYVISNPVRHGLVKDAKCYPYCSAAWFERHNRSSFCRRVYSYRCDTVKEPDEFEVVWE